MATAQTNLDQVNQSLDNLEAEITGRGELGMRTIRFETEGDPYSEFERIGHIPLPPAQRRRQ